MGTHKKAKQSFEAAIETSPDSTNAHYGAANACAELGETEKAKEHLEKFKVLKARDEKAHRDGLKSHDDVFHVRWDTAEVYKSAAKVYVVHEDLRTAQSHLRKGGDLCPAHPECLHLLAWLYEREGRLDEAMETWRITFQFSEGEGAMELRSRQAEWTVPDEAWETIKGRSREEEARVTITGVRGAAAEEVLSQASIGISTSEDEVGSPLFFREVNLPFFTAVKDPAAHIRWRFGPISSSKPPPIVLENLPLCGNCHSFSADGAVLGLDVDYANDKGSYAIMTVEEEMTIDKGNLITWYDYQREDGEPTFGLLSQVSPDGKYTVSTVKDQSVFVPRPDLAFSQLFFPTKGILVVYNREAETFEALPGADDKQFVQSNPVWSPDGETIVFARAEAYDLEGLEDVKSVVIPPEAAKEFLEGGKTFRYDLYRIPFNDGKGGRAEPIEGASHNGMSNYFPKFSPDGKWIVFCKAKSFMLLQPDSELYIIPAEGGQARRLRCNTSRMNSWHSWSPNGHWLVFSSKAYSSYTQLFLAHIDEQGRSSVPVVLSRFTEPERAANIPEFVNVKPEAIESISAAFLDDNNFYRAADEFIKQDDLLGAIPLLQKVIELNPGHVRSRFKLVPILMDLGRIEEARAHLHKILEYEPDHAGAHHHLAVILGGEGKPQEAAAHCRQALESAPKFFAARMSLGLILLETGDVGEAGKQLAEAVRLEPGDTYANYYYGHVLHRQGKLEAAAGHYTLAVESDPDSVPALLGLAVIHIMPELPDRYDVEKAIRFAEKACELTNRRSPDVLKILASVYGAAERKQDALRTAAEALRVARVVGDEALAR
ncbi:tetratricopeptide repeat protein [Planctomycetota bacterium]